ncbi:MAG: hypothetical protein MHM6MM_006434, partial [Cercozoa sp. M6MM]
TQALDAWHREHTGGDTARAQAVSFLRTSVQLESKQVQNLLTSLPSHRVLQKAAALASENGTRAHWSLGHVLTGSLGHMLTGSRAHWAERLAQKKLAALHMDELAGVSLTVERRVSVASSAHSSASTLPSSASHMNLLQQQQQQQQQQQHETTTLGKKPMPLHLLSLPVFYTHPSSLDIHFYIFYRYVCISVYICVCVCVCMFFFRYCCSMEVFLFWYVCVMCLFLCVSFCFCNLFTYIHILIHILKYKYIPIDM